jgi:hypothetical protein
VNEEKYFQFMLSALAFYSNPTDRLNAIISFSLIETGLSVRDKLDPGTRVERAKAFKKAKDTPSDFQANDELSLAVMLGAKEIGVVPGSIQVSIQKWRQLRDLRKAFEEKHGPDAQVRVRKDLCFETRDNGFSYREFAVLAAIYSCIGAKSYPARVTRKQIQHRALGYKSAKVMDAELSTRTDGELPLTFRQINYVIDKLHERQFFSRGRANERQTFYSTRLDQAQLEDRLLRGKTYSKEFHERRRARNANLMAKIKERKAIKVDNE